jgi:P27 family predicted phage terminase small subunit
MGVRGPKALPANVHLLRSNPSKKSLDDLFNEFNPEVEIPDYPSWMWPEAKKEWKRVSTELLRYGLISKLDRAALVLYVQAWAKMVWAEQQMSKAMKLAEQKRKEAEERGEEYTGGDGIMVKTAGGNLIYSHHWVVGRRAAEDVNRYLASFGMSPSARGRVSPSENRQQSLDLGGEGGNAFSAL